MIQNMVLSRTNRSVLRQLHCSCYSFKTFNLRSCSSDASSPGRILSGIQPTGVLHIGNYFGAVKNWVELQNSVGNVFCSIVDLHSITLPYDASKLSQNILLMTACLLGCGINPEKSTLFLQSDIPEHTQLCWILGSLATLRRLGQLPQYVEKSELTENTPLGLLWYPVLQAADILIYRASRVPVGKDQVQHLQLASNVARKFNLKYGDTFPVPRPILNNDNASRIRSLQNPAKKMSKSYPDSNSRIEITDSPEMIASKLKLAQVEHGSNIIYDSSSQPGMSNLLAIHSMLTGREILDISSEFRNFDSEKYKEIVTEALIETMTPIQSEIRRLMGSKEYLKNVLCKGAEKATEIAADTWSVISRKTGNYITR